MKRLVVFGPLLLLFTLSTLPGTGVLANPEGPPLQACGDMLTSTSPGVEGEEGCGMQLPQNKWPGPKRVSPFYIHIEKSNVTYEAGEEYKVRLMANQSEQHAFYKGVFMQARRLRCMSYNTDTDTWDIQVESRPVGRFWVDNSGSTCSDDSLLKTVDCFGIDRSAVGHCSVQYKVNELVEWTAPDDYDGPIIFKATFVLDASTYWTDIYSRPFLTPGETEAPACDACLWTSHVSLLMATLLCCLFNL